MAICQHCDKDMLRVDDCSWNRTVEYPDGKTLPSLPMPKGITRCGDCNIKAGNYHHAFCDQERCPRCQGQLISCGCLDEEEDE